jgi:hypothetical protein
MASSALGKTAWLQKFSNGITVQFDLSMLEPSERAAARKMYGLSKFAWKELKGRIGAGRATALKRAGMDVRRATQRSMSVRRELSKPRYIESGTKDGKLLVIKRYMIPKPDRVTSWKTDRNPKGFLRSDIISDYDFSTASVVIGPRKIPELNRLHEVGGKVSLWFTPGVTPKNAPRKYKGATFGTLSNKPHGEQRTEDLGGAFFWGRRRVKGRKYMKTGLEKAMPKIPAAFTDFINGPTVSPVNQLKLF